MPIPNRHLHDDHDNDFHTNRHAADHNRHNYQHHSHDDRSCDDNHQPIILHRCLRRRLLLCPGAQQHVRIRKPGHLSLGQAWLACRDSYDLLRYRLLHQGRSDGCLRVNDRGDSSSNAQNLGLQCNAMQLSYVRYVALKQGKWLGTRKTLVTIS